jgi:hypothetical protein
VALVFLSVTHQKKNISVNLHFLNLIILFNELILLVIYRFCHWSHRGILSISIDWLWCWKLTVSMTSNILVLNVLTFIIISNTAHPIRLAAILVIIMAFNIFQVYQYFTIYRRCLLFKFEQFSWISYTTLFTIRRYQRPFILGRKSTWYHPLLKGLDNICLDFRNWHYSIYIMAVFRFKALMEHA